MAPAAAAAAIEETSIPEQNAFSPDPVMQTARTASSASARSKASRKAATSVSESALRCAGRSRISQSARSRRSSRSSGGIAATCRSPARPSSEHGADHRDEAVDVALAEVVLAAGLDERAEHGLDPRLVVVAEEQVGEPHLEGLGDLGQRLEVWAPLAPLD